MLTVFTSTTTMNTLLNIGMRRSCDTVCQPNDGTCQDKDKKDNELPKDIIECPPGNDCQFVSQDVFDTGEPVGNAVVVRSCSEFVEAVCNKSEAKRGKVDVFFNGHGNIGRFFINDECVSKGNACYKMICKKLKKKIKTLTLYTCSTTEGRDGKTFVQCLANCLNAVVHAWEKDLHTDWFSFLFFSTAPKWSTQRGFTDPFEAKPVTNGTSITPTYSVVSKIPNATSDSIENDYDASTTPATNVRLESLQPISPSSTQRVKGAKD